MGAGEDEWPKWRGSTGGTRVAIDALSDPVLVSSRGFWPLQVEPLGRDPKLVQPRR